MDETQAGTQFSEGFCKSCAAQGLTEFQTLFLLKYAAIAETAPTPQDAVAQVTKLAAESGMVKESFPLGIAALIALLGGGAYVGGRLQQRHKENKNTFVADPKNMEEAQALHQRMQQRSQGLRSWMDKDYKSKGMVPPQYWTAEQAQMGNMATQYGNQIADLQKQLSIAQAPKPAPAGQPYSWQPKTTGNYYVGD